MSGLCGWAGAPGGAFDLANMAAPLRRRMEPVRSARCDGGALAFAGPGEQGRVFHDDGLLIASWGGCAATLARQWRTGGAGACVHMGDACAFALIDEYRGEALLGTDRLASRPLYYRVDDGVLLFSTDPVMNGAPVEHPSLDPQALFDYLYFQYIPPATGIQGGQYKLGPGEVVHFTRGRALRTRPAAAFTLGAMAGATSQVQLAAPSLADAVPEMAAALGQPFGKPVLGLAWLTAQRAASRGDTVAFDIVLDAERHAREQQRSRYWRLPGPVRQVLIEPMLFHLLAGVHTASVDALRGRIAQSVAGLPEALEASSLLGIYGIDQVVDRDLLSVVDCHRPRELLRDAWWETYGEDDANRLATIDLQFEVAGGALPAYAAACNAFGVPLTIPALSAATATATLGNLPSARPWLEADEHLRALAYDSLLDLRRRHIVREKFIDMLLSMSAPANAEMVWMLMMLEQWLSARSRAPREIAHDEPAAICK